MTAPFDFFLLFSSVMAENSNRVFKEVLVHGKKMKIKRSSSKSLWNTLKEARVNVSAPNSRNWREELRFQLKG